MTLLGELTEKERLVLRLIHKIGKESRAKEIGGWIRSGWLLSAITFPIHPSELLCIARSLEKEAKIQIRRNRDPRDDGRVLPRAFECRMILKKARRGKRK